MEREHVRDLTVDRRMTLKWTLKKLGIRVQNRFIWLRIRFSEGLLQKLCEPSRRFLTNRVTGVSLFCFTGNNNNNNNNNNNMFIVELFGA
jgi:hypothetical protein